MFVCFVQFQPGSYSEQNSQRKWKIHSETGETSILPKCLIFKTPSKRNHKNSSNSLSIILIDSSIAIAILTFNQLSQVMFLSKNWLSHISPGKMMVKLGEFSLGY